MGFYYRKSVRAGPFRINMSRSGIGYSVGGRGFRTGVSGSGRRYTNVSLPGTGVGYRMGGRGCGLMLVAGVGIGLGALTLAATVAKGVL